MTNEAIAAIRHYHQETKHSSKGYAPSPGFLDWDAQPDPFRRFLGAPEVKLPLIKGTGYGHYEDLFDALPPSHAPLTLDQFGLFFELALGLSAWKVAGPDRWALRNNPSSGNLHPTEGYLILWQSVSDDLSPGLYHYAPHDHVLEHRATLPPNIADEISRQHPETFGAVAFSSITWREEWKYGARAYRYCLLDMGHALGSTRFGSAVLGWSLSLDLAISDDSLKNLLGLDREDDFGEAEREIPEAIALLSFTPNASAPDWTTIMKALEGWKGHASQASAERVSWPQIAKAIPASHKAEKTPSAVGPVQTIPRPAFASRPPKEACTLIRNRRSAQRMDPAITMKADDFEQALSRTLPAAHAPFDALPATPFFNLLLFVHGVDGMEQGLYALIRTPDLFDAFQQSCTSASLSWEPIGETTLPLYRLDAPRDVRKLASQLCCYQGIAGRGAFSVGMIGAFDHALAQHGAWAYRLLHWEAGLIAQTLYLEAEASGLSGTGIGCFFDDEVHHLLSLNGDGLPGWQTLYHFTIGGAVTDTRLLTEEAYHHLKDRAWR